MAISDISTIDLTSVVIGREATTCEFDLLPPFYTGKDFYLRLVRNYSDCYLWVMTYTASITGFGLQVERLLHGQPCAAARAKQVRMCSNIHTKLIIAWRSRQNPVAAFVGSQNWVAPTQINVMVEIKPHKDIKHLVDYYRHIWNQCK